MLNATEDTVTLTREARDVTEGVDLAGEQIVYDIAKDKLEVEGGKSRSRYKTKAELVAEIPERPCGPRPAKVAPKPFARAVQRLKNAGVAGA